jgi:hypothetical protein
MPPGAMPGAAGNEIPKTELTETSAKGAIDAYLELQKKYGDDLPDPDPKKSTAEAYAELAEVESIVKSQGFSDTGEWHTTLISVAMAYGFAKDDNAQEIDESIAKLKDNPQIPEGLKQQMLATITGLRPSENNLAVVKSLMADGDYGAKLADLGK